MTGDPLGLIAVLTGVAAVIARSAAMLTATRDLIGDRLSRRLERATAAGVMIGVVMSAVGLLVGAP